MSAVGPERVIHPRRLEPRLTHPDGQFRELACDFPNTGVGAAGSAWVPSVGMRLMVAVEASLLAPRPEVAYPRPVLGEPPLLWSAFF